MVNFGLNAMFVWPEQLLKQKLTASTCFKSRFLDNFSEGSRYFRQYFPLLENQQKYH